MLCFTSKGVKAACFHRDKQDSIRAVEEGHYELVITTPESLFTTKWCKIMQTDVWQSNLVALVVDEAHCVQKWYVSLILCICTSQEMYICMSYIL